MLLFTLRAFGRGKRWECALGNVTPTHDGRAPHAADVPESFAHTCWHALVLLFCVLFFVVTGAAQSDQSSPFLELGKPVRREIVGGEAHSYRVILATGQFLHVDVDQGNLHVVLKLFSPNGEQILETDSPNSLQGPEPVFLLAKESGSYRLEVVAPDKVGNQREQCGVLVKELRAGTAQDSERVAGQQALNRAEQLRKQGTAESLRNAIKDLETALPLWRAAADRRGEAASINALGKIYASLGDNRKALETFNLALPLWRDLHHPRGEAQTLYSMGTVYHTLGQPQKALESFQQGLPLKRAAGDVRGEAEILNGIGAVSAMQGENREALKFFGEALALWRKAGDRIGEASVLANFGHVHGLLAENRKALEYSGQALALAKAQGDRRSEGVLLNNMGRMFAALAENQKALDHYNQAILLSRTVGDRRLEGVTLNNLGALYYSLGENEKALDHYSQALRLKQAVGDRGGEATSLTNIGYVYSLLGDTEKAQDYFNRALPLSRTVGDRRLEGNLLNNIGEVQFRKGSRENALAYYDQALNLKRAVGDRQSEAYTLNNIGLVYSALADKQKALDHYNQALSLWREVDDRSGEAATLYGMAKVVVEAGDLQTSRERIQAALRIVESQRSQLASRELRASYFASIQDYYGLYIYTLMMLHSRQPTAGYDATALEASERARARNLIEALSESWAGIRQGINPGLVERERSLEQLIDAKAERQIRLLSGKHTEQQALELRKEIGQLLAEYQEVESTIRHTSPRYAALTQTEPVRTREIQEHLLDNDTALLEYALGETHSYLWVVTPEAISTFELPRRAEIETTVRRFYDSLTARSRHVGETEQQRRARLDNAEIDRLESAEFLSRVLIQPAVALLSGKRLLIVPDGVLNYVPFAALPAPGRRAGEGPVPLIVQHEIVTLPSASTLNELRRDRSGSRPAPKIAAVLADPVFEREDGRIRRPRRAPAEGAQRTDQMEAPATVLAADGALERAVIDVGLSSSQLHLPRLPFTRREAEAVLALVKAGEGMKALDFRANLAMATNPELGQYRIVHFATHGLLNAEHPALSGLALSLYDEQGRPQNGFLKLQDIYNLNLRAELVVLSACRTALGKEIKGEGLIGLTRGFMYTGAKRVLASLWNVDDVGTADLIEKFYRGMLVEGLRPAAALQAAQVAMWKSRRWTSPYYWAGFVMQGEFK